MRHSFTDHGLAIEISQKASSVPGIDYYTTKSLGKSQSLTNEGFLLCRDVAIARTGELIYGPDETPVPTGKDGMVKVQRDADEVFRPETLASWNGKPVTNDHPPEEVTPDNFKSYVVGVIQNVRRGSGIDDDYVFADLLIQDAEAIEAVRDGKREVSCGYDAEYDVIEPGRGRQKNIVGNHVALVEQGRCGPRCSIQDRSTEMAKPTVFDRIRAAFLVKDQKSLDEAIKDAEGMGMGSSKPEGEGINVHVHNYGKGGEAKDDEEGGENKNPFANKKEGKEGEEQDTNEEEGSVEARLDRLEAMIKKLAGSEETGDEGGAKGKEETSGEVYDTDNEEEEGKGGEEKTKDSKSKVQDLKSRAELLSPGFKVPTFDAKDPKKFRDAVCKCKRKALDAAVNGEHSELLTPLLGGVEVEKLAAPTVDAIFIAASELIRQKNNKAGTRDNVTRQDFGKSVSVSDINAKNAQFWADRRKSA